MSDMTWAFTGAGIYVFVALALPMIIAAVLGKAPTEEDARMIVGLSWLWPLAGPIALVVVLPACGFAAYSRWLTEKPEGERLPSRRVE